MKILVYIDSLERFHFFKRFIFIKNDFVCITNLLSVYIMAKKENMNCHLIKKRNIDNISSKIDHKDTLDFKAGWLSKEEIETVYNSIYYLAEQLYGKHQYTYMFIWNGTRVAAKALKDIAQIHNIKVLYFEVSNLPNKLFIDKMGVNAKSYLALDKNILKSFSYDDSLYLNWRKEYLLSKFKTHKVIQSRNVKAINILHVFDWIGFNILNIVKSKSIPVYKKILQKILIYRTKFKYDTIDIKNEKYIFFPLQVNSDSQILINSDINNTEAVEIAAQLAREAGVKLLIKPHPAEADVEYVSRLNRLKEDYGFYFVDDNTFELIKYAVQVVTINSTVGIESMILQKDVKVLGRSHYAEFDQEDLGRYISSYLIDIDYFGEDVISKEKTEEIMKRAVL